MAYRIKDALASPLVSPDGQDVLEHALFYVRGLVNPSRIPLLEGRAKLTSDILSGQDRNKFLTDSERQLSRLYIVQSVWRNEGRLRQLMEELAPKRQHDILTIIQSKKHKKSNSNLFMKSRDIILESLKNTCVDVLLSEAIASFLERSYSATLEPLIEFRNAICHGRARSDFDLPADPNSKTKQSIASRLYAEADTVLSVMIDEILHECTTILYKMIAGKTVHDSTLDMCRSLSATRHASPNFALAPFRTWATLFGDLRPDTSQQVKDFVAYPVLELDHLLRFIDGHSSSGMK